MSRTKSRTVMFEYLEKVRPDRSEIILKRLSQSDFLALFSKKRSSPVPNDDGVPDGEANVGDANEWKEWHSPAVFETYYQSLMKMLAEHKRKNYAGIARRYTQRSGGDGRAYVEGFGLQRCHGALRNFLTEGLMHDYDIVNAHPTLLLAMSKEWGLQLPALERYVGDRAACLDEMQLSKKDVLIRLNCDASPQWNAKTDLERQLVVDFAEARTYAFGRFSEEYPSTNENNPKASALNKVLNARENAVLAEKLNSIPNLETCVPMFDGFLTDLEIDMEAGPQGTVKWIDKAIVNTIEVDDDAADFGGGGRNDEVNAERTLQFFKGRIFRTNFGLMMYDEDRGTWTMDDEMHMRLIQTKSGEFFVDTSTNQDKSFRALYNDAIKLIKCKAPEKRLADLLGMAKGKLCFRNGVLDMRTITMSEHKPEYYFFQRIDRDFPIQSKESPGYPVLEERAREVRAVLFDKPFTDVEKRDFVLECEARGLAGHVEDRRCLVLLGKTMTGKGKVTELL